MASSCKHLFLSVSGKIALKTWLRRVGAWLYEAIRVRTCHDPRGIVNEIKRNTGLLFHGS